MALEEGYRGAEAVLAATEATQAPASATTTERPEKLSEDIKAFVETLPKLEPGTAAHEWIDLALRYAKAPHENEEDFSAFGNRSARAGNPPLRFATLLDCLPPPRAWEALRKELETRNASNDNAPEIAALRLVADWINGDEAAQDRDLKNLTALFEGGRFADNGKGMFPRLMQDLLQNSDDGEAILRNLSSQLDQAKEQGLGIRLDLPDLVSIVGEKKAAEFIRRALANNVEVAVEHGIETQTLARKIALEMVGSIKVPPWSLIKSVDAGPLYEALAKKFPEGPGDDSRRQNARNYYLVGLIAERRTKEAAEIVRNGNAAYSFSLTEDALEFLQRRGHARDLAEFFDSLLKKNPDLPFWEYYRSAAVQSGGTEQMVMLAETAANRKNLSTPQRMQIQTSLRSAYLAADKLDEGLRILRREIKDNASEPGTAPSELYDRRAFSQEDPELAMMRLGVVLHRDDLIAEGERAIREALARNVDPKNSEQRVSMMNRLADFLMELQRGPEAEAVLADALAVGKARRAGPNSSGSFPSMEQETLMKLALVYHRARRSQDVLALLQTAGQWGAKDLAEIFTATVSERNEEYLGLIAARALAHAGQKSEAEKTLSALLDQIDGYDPAYELLIELKGEDAFARLDELQARDKFEERPLIWKAKLLLDLKKLPEAEAAARAAIAIDPSDGEQGPGRRMRVYSVLADIREARGDAKEAEGLRGVVTAIRKSEEADRFYEAGLLTRAVKMYAESLTHFANAYCIQSRLALRLVETGDDAAAEEHYRRAYELMPDSFGRVESHCFGCEKAFAGERAQSLAEKVFSNLIAKNPSKPQVHYLLGYLRKEENRPREALPEFRKAVELDPEYLNAWKSLAELGTQVRLLAPERQAIQFKMLQLDPLGRRTTFDINAVSDFRSAWNALEDAVKLQSEKPKVLFPLTASSAELEKAERRKPDERHPIFPPRFAQDEKKKRIPARALAEHPFLQDIASLFDYALRAAPR
jgi:tetratricopeptide (TPR) repeat protein